MATLASNSSDLVVQLPDGGTSGLGEASEFLRLTDEDTLALKTPAQGATTPNSDSTRTELREQDSWRLSEGPSSMSTTMTINAMPSEGGVVIGQIHQEGGNGRPPVILRYEDGNIVLSIMDGDGRRDVTVAEGIELGEEFSYTMETGPDGQLIVSIETASGETFEASEDISAFSDADLYFKAGSYLQNGQSGSGAGEIVMDIPDITHG